MGRHEVKVSRSLGVLLGTENAEMATILHDGPPKRI